VRQGVLDDNSITKSLYRVSQRSPSRLSSTEDVVNVGIELYVQWLCLHTGKDEDELIHYYYSSHQKLLASAAVRREQPVCSFALSDICAK
jgi:hypothetical protein